MSGSAVSGAVLSESRSTGIDCGPAGPGSSGCVGEETRSLRQREEMRESPVLGSFPAGCSPSPEPPDRGPSCPVSHAGTEWV